MKVKSAMAVICSLTSCLSLAVTPLQLLAEEEVPSRAIYVVYDDSGSMYSNGGKRTDRWSYAKYSMEVLASMLGEEDTMDIYYMSDYSPDGAKAGPRIEISGKDSSQINVSKIHDEMTVSGKTPFETVEAAYSDLRISDADEKWLIVLTDGDFQKEDTISDDKTEVTEFMDDFFESKDPDIEVTFLGIGDNVVPITDNDEDGIYYEQAKNSNQILQRVTDISNRIFNTNRISLPSGADTFTIDVPVSSLTIFAQGDGASVTGLETEEGKSVGVLNQTVKVNGPEESDNESYTDSPSAEGLQGEIAVYDGEFEPGTYKLKVDKAKIIEVYYKPDLAVSAYLTTSSGERIDDLSEIPTGDYTIHFELVSGRDGSELPKNNMVSRSEEGVEYRAQILNNGNELEATYKDGDTVHLDQGDLEIDVTAKFLKYNTVDTHLNYSVWENKTVTFESDAESAAWNLKDSMTAEKPITLSAKVEGKTPTSEEWEQAPIPTVKAVANDETDLSDPIVEKSEDPGLYLIWPNEKQTEFRGITYDQASLTVDLNGSVDQIPWKGTKQVEVPIEDHRGWFTRNSEFLSRNWYWILLLPIIGIALVGYLLKKRLPKLPDRLNIECEPKNDRRKKTEYQKGTFMKDGKSVWLPFVAETGVIKYLPVGSEITLPKLKVKAVGNGQMEITNLKAFKHADERELPIIDGEIIALDSKKPVLLKKSSVITVEGENTVYRCVLNQKYRKNQ